MSDEEEFDDFEDASDNEQQDVKSSSSDSKVWQPVTSEPEVCQVG